MKPLIKDDIVFIEHIHAIDFTIILFCILLFLVIPFLMNRKGNQENDENFLLMDRKLSFPLFAATLTSTWYGGIIGVTQVAFLNGLYGFVTQGLFWYVAYLIFALFLAKRIRKNRAMSLPELLGNAFGNKARKISSVILFFHALPITYCLSIGMLLNLLTGIEFFLSVLLGTGLVALYSSLGGFKTVVITDCLQFILMFFAVITLLIFLISSYGGYNFLVKNLPPNYFLWRGQYNALNVLVWLFVACSTTFVHPAFYQRCMAAKDYSTARNGIICATFLWLIFDICTSLGGMYAKALIPNAKSQEAYLILAVQVLPMAFKGIFISGVIATVLSTLDSFLFVSGTTLSYDLCDKRKMSHPLGIFFSFVAVIIVARFNDFNFESIWFVMEGVFSVTMLIPIVAAITTKRKLSQKAFILPCILALVVFMISLILKAYQILDFQGFYVAHIAALLGFLIAIFQDSNQKMLFKRQSKFFKV